MKWLDKTLIHSPISYGLCTSESDFHKELNKLNVPPGDWPLFISPDADATMHHFTSNETHSECCIVCIRRTKHPVHQITALLGHEAVHVWQRIRRNIGEDFPSDEFEAYAIQTIIHNLVEAYYDQKRGKK